MKLKHRFAALFLVGLLFLPAGISAEASAKTPKADKRANVSITVLDKDGKAISFAEVTVGEGEIHRVTDMDGKVSFTAHVRDYVTIEKEGYNKVNVLVEAIADSKSVTLYEYAIQAGDDDKIYLPYSEMIKRYSVGSTIVIKGEDLEKYSSTDIRNALTAIAPGVDVKENFADPGVNPLENTNRYGAEWSVSPTARGKRMMYMLDDVPVHINETPLDPQQIESITIVRDVLEKTMYGPSAADGIVYIKTKRGNYNNRYLNVFAEAGVNMTDKMPEYVSGADYARLNNIARKNSGMDLLYSQKDVEAYAKNDPHDPFHPNIDFRQMMLKNTMYYAKAGIQSGGGNDVIRYYAYLGYSGEDDIYKIGPAADYNRVNINANLDIKLHKYIKARFGLVSTMGIRRSSNYGYSPNYSSDDENSNTTLGVTEFPDIISDINGIPAIAFPIYANNDPSLSAPWYAVTSQYNQNPIANILENGSYTETIRKGMFDVGIDIDFSFLTPGLKSMTYGAFDANNLVRLGTAEDYAAYILTPKYNDGVLEMVPELSGSHSVKEMSNKTKLLDYFSNRFYFVQKFSYDRTFGKHRVNAGVDYMITKRSQKFITEHRREMNFGFDAGYVYDDRFIVRTAMNWHGTYSLLRSWSYSPSVGLGWIMSSEDWLKDAEGLDYLKLRLQAGLLHYDSATSANRDVDNYSWNNGGSKFGPHQNNQWFGSTQSENINRTQISMLGNPNLRLEQRKEIIAGVDGMAFDQRFDFSLSYYNVLSDGPITQLQNVLPLVTGISSGALWMNYNKTRYQGLELSLGWKDKVGDFTYSINGWASSNFSKVLRVDEMNYKEAYRSKVGYSDSAIWGLRHIGTFKTDEETLEVPQLFDEKLSAGDLKYEDMNGDGFIDDNDVCVIGDSAPKLIYGLSVNLKYRDFDLLLTGTGRAFYDIAMTNSYFWNGWGDGNYSKYTLDKVGSEGHPALSYNKVENNYKTSTFWLEKGGFFKLQTVELGYELPVRKLNISRGLRGLRIYVRGNNLFTISGVKYVDPEAINSGVSNYPLMRTVVAGLKITF